MKLIHVLLVNDSVLVSQVIKKILLTEPMFDPIGWAKNGLEAENYIQAHIPDIILMDIHMPLQDGVETTKKILTIHSIPILLVTSTISSNMSEIFQCMQYGALEATKPPHNPAFKNIDHLTQDQLRQLGTPFLKKVLTIARLKNRVKTKETVFPRPEFRKAAVAFSAEPTKKTASDLVVIGSSTGGPTALTQLLKFLPYSLLAAVIIVQHINTEFVPSLINYLQQFSELPIQTALEGESPKNGHVYLAYKEGYHLKCSEGKTFSYCGQPMVNHMPSIDILFDSVAKNYGHHVTGVLLTGMGKDGAAGLKNIRDHGGLTITQDEESSLIYGMPKAALELGASMEVLDVSKIGQRIVEFYYFSRSQAQS